MNLGGMDNKRMGYVPDVQSNIFAKTDFDFTALSRKVDSIDQRQNYLLIGIAILIILTLTKK